MTEELIRLRQEIDDVDEQIIKLLAYRLKLSRKIGKIELRKIGSQMLENIIFQRV